MRLFSRLFVHIALALVVQATAAPAQEPARQPHLRASPAPALVPPPPAPQVVEKDVDEAIAVIKEREQAIEATREAARGFERRPNLDRSVVEGIQTLNIRRSLRR